MPERFEVVEPSRLQPFLRRRLQGWALKTIKQRMRSGCIVVNGARVTRHDHWLEEGDRVEVGDHPAADAPNHGNRGFKTLYVDQDLIAIDKPVGLLSVSTDREQRRTALALVRDSLSTPKKQAMLWPVHRLDRETSGVLLFARSREIRDDLQAEWTEAEKSYLAVVEGHPDPASGIIDQPLWEDKSLNVRVGRNEGSKDARTHFRIEKRGQRRSLLEIELETGRRHQIRAHLAWLGHPVVGDARYGVAGPRLGLHAFSLSVTHPRDRARLTFQASAPRAFMALVDGK